MPNGTNGTSHVATNDGELVEMQDLAVPATRIYNFVNGATKNNVNRKAAYFEGHSLEWALDEIITRGMAEIDRNIGNTAKLATNRAAGNVLKEYGMSPEQAKVLLAELLRKQAESAKQG